jgi:uncharacterized Tic20 family protein
MSVAMPVDDRCSQSPPLGSVPGGPDPTHASTPTGRLRQDGVSGSDRNMAVAIHLSPLVMMGVLGPLALAIPLVLWLIRKDDSPFVDDHGREVLNFGVSFLLLHLLLAITVIGLAFIPVLWIVGIVNVIRGAVSAGTSEYFRYPLTIRLFH